MTNGPLPAYYVDPADTSAISRTDLSGVPLCTKGDDRQGYNLPSGNPTYNPDHRVDVYEAILATYTFPRGYYGTPTTAFEGNIKDDAARVRETAVPVSMLTLYNIKVGELNQYAIQVFESAFSLTWNAKNFWVLNDELSRDARSSYNGHLGAKAGDILFDAVAAGIADPGGTNGEVAAFWNNIKARQQGSDPWWVRDIKVFVFIDDPGQPDDLKQVTDTANQNQWVAITEAEATFNWQTRNANDRVLQDINDAYGDGSGVPGGPEWNQLASIDVDAAQYNWPKHYASPPNPQLGTTGPLANGL